MQISGANQMDILPRIYLVDDDEHIRSMLSRMLQTRYQVTCFSRAHEFLDVAAALAAIIHQTAL
jgi:FixJ family two-component response regulator